MEATSLSDPTLRPVCYHHTEARIASQAPFQAIRLWVEADKTAKAAEAESLRVNKERWRNRSRSYGVEKID